MPHADSTFVPSNITTKAQFWAHVLEQLEGLLSGQRTWVSNCANTASLVHHSLLAFPSHFGSGERVINWCGFYIDSSLFPWASLSPNRVVDRTEDQSKLLLGPFSGKPACQFIDTSPSKVRGVCADAFMQKKTILVPEVDLYPGHIACDAETKSEIVCPLLLEGRSIGVLDLDCLTVNGFDEDDRVALERIASLVVKSCDW
ncbi:hypothetical protein ACEPAG_7683 [Sanghuangporus baumii]